MLKSIQAKRERRRESAAVWEERIRRCRESGLAVRTFCRQEKFGMSSLYRWRLKLKVGAGPSGRAPSPKEGHGPETPFIPVRVKEGGAASRSLPPGTWACEVVGPRGVRVRLRERPDLAGLREVVAVLAGEA